MATRYRAARATAGASALLLAVVLSACGGSDDVMALPPADLAGEYTYAITDAGGACGVPPRSSGSGVVRISQSGAAASYCVLRDLCDGEACRSGTIAGSILTGEDSGTATEGVCLYRWSTTETLTQREDGRLLWRIDHARTYLSGDCTALALPCAWWQTIDAARCADGCYDLYCGLPRRPRGAASM